MELMKKTLLLVAIVILAGAVSNVPAQRKAQSGKQGQTAKQAQHTIHDQNGDGICDHCGQTVGSGLKNAQGQKAMKGKHFGPGDGSGNQGAGPQDGTGAGAKSGQRSGTQDGTGAAVGQSGNTGRGGSPGQGRKGKRP